MGTSALEVIVAVDGAITTFSAIGRIDTNTAPIFEEKITEFFEKEEKTDTLVIDFARVEYISSAGLRALLVAQKKSLSSGVEMVVTNISQEVAEVFDVTGFSDILTIR